MSFYDLVRDIESRRGEVIDLITGAPLSFDGIGRLLGAELAAPRWIDARRLGAYADYDGIGEFVEMLVGRWSAMLGRQLDPREVMVTPGAQGALTLVLHWLATAGRRPLYPLALEFPGAVARAGRSVGRYRSVPYGADGHVRAVLPDPAELDWSGVGAVLLSQPHNPTGVAFSPEELATLVAAAGRHDALVVIDRTYALPEAPMAVRPPPVPVDTHVVQILSFSKVGLASERVGVLIGPADLVTELRSIQRRLFLQTPKVGQALAAALLDGLDRDPELAAGVGEAYRTRWWTLRDALAAAAPEALAAGRLRAHEWQGGPFLWAELVGASDQEVVRAALREGVAVLPGSELGLRSDGENPNAIRVGLGAPVDVLADAGQRLGKALRTIVG